MKRIISIFLILMYLTSNVEASSIFPDSPYNFEIPFLGIKIGKQSYKISKISENHQISSDMTIRKVVWLIDGQKIKEDKNTKLSQFNPYPHIKKSNSINIIQYKAGKDPITNRSRHKVNVIYDGGNETWFIQE